jgi:hypothetical protein
LAHEPTIFVNQNFLPAFNKPTIGDSADGSARTLKFELCVESRIQRSSSHELLDVAIAFKANVSSQDSTMTAVPEVTAA